MLASPQEMVAVLRQYNPWWEGKAISDLPTWRRAAYGEIRQWVTTPPAPRAILLSGPRQVGKTTLLLQAIQDLLAGGVSPSNILYVTFDHPLLKLSGVEAVLRLWREIEPRAAGPEFIFADEIQFLRDWQTWIKHQVDFQKDRRIIVTGSATPLMSEGQESGVGRWHTIRLSTLSFYEFLQIKKEPLPEIPEVRTLTSLFEWSEAQLARVGDASRSLVVQFHEYLVRGGFPQCALTPSVDLAQKLLREDIVDKVLKRDMTALFGVRRILELEQTFLYLCLHDGGLLDVTELCKNLEVKKATANNFVGLLENTHLIYRLPPLGYGKEILRARYKVYLADAAIAPSVLLKGKALLEDDAGLGRAVETAFFKHVFTRYYDVSVGFSYWRGRQDQEVDIVAAVGNRLIPFEVKYRKRHTGKEDIQGLIELCTDKKLDRGYVITRDIMDFSTMSFDRDGKKTRLLKIPAPLACYWLGQSEVSSASGQRIEVED